MMSLTPGKGDLRSVFNAERPGPVPKHRGRTALQTLVYVCRRWFVDTGVLAPESRARTRHARAQAVPIFSNARNFNGLRAYESPLFFRDGFKICDNPLVYFIEFLYFAIIPVRKAPCHLSTVLSEHGNRTAQQGARGRGRIRADSGLRTGEPET